MCRLYAELYIPVVSPDMGVPLVHSFDLSISGRYDSYSDVGSTTNPKFAANWEPVEGVKLRGNYSRAFVAPPTAVIGDPTQGHLYASGSVGVNGTQIVCDARLHPGWLRDSIRRMHCACDCQRRHGHEHGPVEKFPWHLLGSHPRSPARPAFQRRNPWRYSENSPPLTLAAR